MKKLNIELDPDLVGQPNHPPSPRSDDPVFESLLNNSYVEVMMRALEGKGVRVSCDNPRDAHAVRFRYYNMRRKLHRKGIFSLDDVMITIEGSDLLIRPGPKTIVRDL